MSDSEDLLKPESRESYEADAAGYFRNIGTTKMPGISADEQALIDKKLPGQREQAEFADKLARGLDKTARSGARVNSATAVPAIFPDGLKKASEFIDSVTPGKYKPQEEMKPPDQQKKPTGWFPKPAAVVDICIDCVKQIDPRDYAGGLTIIAEEDTEKCAAMGVKYGDLVVYCVCGKCRDKALQEGRNSTPLALVFGGNLMTEEQIKLAIKYNFPINLHDGQERTLGQWRMVERAERIMENLYSYLRSENQKPDSPVFRNRDNAKN